MQKRTALLIFANIALFGGLAWRGDHIRMAQGQGEAETETLHAWMDTASPAPEILLPPTVLGSR